MARNTPPLFSHYARQILDALPDGVFISDASGQTLYINRTYEEVTGIRLEHVEGKNVRLLVKEGIFDHVLNPEIVKTGKPATHAQTLKNGMRLVLSGFPVFDANGDVCLVVTFARDITLLSNLQERVAEQHQLIDHMKDQLVHMSHGGSAEEPVFQSAEMLETITRARCFAA
ncbi:PAS domain S-box protein [Desulfovibrio sp.]|uniref:PAS domain S-box protein n=1 Tax=Desulfovibrio sp. TaxID=885 RepID=UPI003426A9F5